MGSEAAGRQASGTAEAARKLAAGDMPSSDTETERAPEVESFGASVRGRFSLAGVTSWWARVPAIVAVVALISITVAGVGRSGGSDVATEADPVEFFQTYVSNVTEEHLQVMREPSLTVEQVQGWWSRWAGEYGYEYDRINEVIEHYMDDELFSDDQTRGDDPSDPRDQIAGDVAFAHSISQSGWFQSAARIGDHNFAGAHPRHDRGVFETYDSVRDGVRGHFYTLYDYYEDGSNWRDVVSVWTGDSGAYWDEVVSAVYGSMLEFAAEEPAEPTGDEPESGPGADGSGTEPLSVDGGAGEGGDVDPCESSERLTRELCTASEPESEPEPEPEPGADGSDGAPGSVVLTVSEDDYATPHNASDVEYVSHNERGSSELPGVRINNPHTLWPLYVRSVIDGEVVEPVGGDDCHNGLGVVNEENDIAVYYCGLTSRYSDGGDRASPGDVLGKLDWASGQYGSFWLGVQVRSEGEWDWYCPMPLMEAVFLGSGQDAVTLNAGECP